MTQTIGSYSFIPTLYSVNIYKQKKGMSFVK